MNSSPRTQAEAGGERGRYDPCMHGPVAVSRPWRSTSCAGWGVARNALPQEFVFEFPTIGQLARHLANEYPHAERLGSTVAAR